MGRGVADAPRRVMSSANPRDTREEILHGGQGASRVTDPNLQGSGRCVRVLLVDDRLMVREGLAGLVDKQPDLEVVGQASNLGDALELDVTADVIIVDIDAPDAKYGDSTARFNRSFPQSRILAISMVSHPAKVQSVLTSGAQGYLLKSAGAADLVAGIRALAAGNTYLQPSLGVDLARWNLTQATTSDLSAREEQVLGLLVLGYTNVEISHYCEVSLRTVEAHRARIHHKLGIRSRAELVQYARRVGLMPSDIR
jgi:DNA-binding NarL/FixJ family response regulator